MPQTLLISTLDQKNLLRLAKAAEDQAWSVIHSIRALANRNLEDAPDLFLNADVPISVSGQCATVDMSLLVGYGVREPCKAEIYDTNS